MTADIPPALGPVDTVIGVGASAGGVEALTELVSCLPADLAAPVLVVLHLAPAGTSVLAQLLGRRTKLQVQAGEDGARLRRGTIYVAPPDQHLVVEDGVVRLTREPRENGHRPAVDPTFRSLARVYGDRAVGVVLSGTRDDGTIGLGQIDAVGGAALVQDPAESLYDGMPLSAIQAVPRAEVLSIERLAARLADLARRPMPPDEPPDDPAVTERPPANYAAGATEPEGRLATRFTCPDCGGVLFEERHGGTEAYVCSVGHAYSPESLQDEQGRSLESALWAAVRSLEDRAVLLRRLAARAQERDNGMSARAFTAQAREHEQRAELVRSVISGAGPLSDAA